MMVSSHLQFKLSISLFVVDGCHKIDVSWEAMTTKSGLSIQYQLYQGRNKSDIMYYYSIVY